MTLDGNNSPEARSSTMDMERTPIMYVYGCGMASVLGKAEDGGNSGHSRGVMKLNWTND